MGMRRTQDRGMQGPGSFRMVIGKSGLALKQRAIFYPLNGLADIGGNLCFFFLLIRFQQDRFKLSE